MFQLRESIERASALRKRKYWPVVSKAKRTRKKKRLLEVLVVHLLSVDSNAAAQKNHIAQN